MNRRNLGLSVAAISLLALVVVIFRQQQRAERLSNEIASLRRQLARTKSLQAENQPLANQLTTAAERMQAEARELAQLRGQASAARQIEQENVRLKAERDRMATEKEQDDAPYDREFREGANLRMRHA